MPDDIRRGKRYFGGTSYSPRRPLQNVAGNPARPTYDEIDRALQAWKMHHMNGLTWDSVAKSLGYSCRQNAQRAASRFWARYGVLGNGQPVGPQNYRSNAPRGLDAHPDNIANRMHRHTSRINLAPPDAVVQWPGDLPIPDGWAYPWIVDGPEAAHWHDPKSSSAPIKQIDHR